MHRDTFFRANVGAIIINSSGQVLAFERAKFKDSWQFPQGGVDKGETLFNCIKREIEEETAIKPELELTFIDEYKDWLAYELADEMKNKKTGRGQVQKWFLFQVNDDQLTIDLAKAQDKEFTNWRWMEMETLTEIVVAFRKSTYTILQNWLADR